MSIYFYNSDEWNENEIPVFKIILTSRNYNYSLELLRKCSGTGIFIRNIESWFGHSNSPKYRRPRAQLFLSN